MRLNQDKSYELLIVTGMSGAGRSTVGKALEDMDWYVVDNLPPQLIRPMAELFSHSDSEKPSLAVVIDARGGELFEDLSAHIDLLRSSNINVQVLFLEANDATLVKRFEQVRRPHPLQGDGTITDGIHAERDRLLVLRSQADYIIDSSDLNVHQLALKISESFATASSTQLNLLIQSFGFKYGAPSDADMIADMRFIPNPFWDERLRPFNGEDAEISDFVLNQEGVEEFISSYVAALRPVITGYLKENRKHAAIAIGCTGGKHRSVAMALELAKRLSNVDGIKIRVKHRDLGKE
ncbi:MAG: RNase adapter RapZ [Micrococcales bacterium]|nr:RNase adapter RapZ [Micrococcales bacterium]NBR54563.1 RNase adapter RapZ [Micrococcales bacterium]NBR60575.1 RNase adapter RapZ [Actinomycetota bacterium]NBT46318.1 RNase adapter RapZ [Actinomycetota bacterium]NBY44297.1 RNase adapter RapZ [Micrococcales bacterium]